MRENKLKIKFLEGENLINSWLTIPSSLTAEIVANSGFDAVTIDMQHGLIDYQTALGMLQGVSTTDAVPMVRVPWNEPVLIMKMLDAGSYGIICPMINNKNEAEKFVNTCKYPDKEYPNGYRSYGPTRASIYGGEDYYFHANKEILTFVMIETAEGLKNVDEILSVKGLDGVYVGTIDLSISMGLQGLGDIKDPKLLQALKKIIAAVIKNNLIAGVHSSVENISFLNTLGFHMLTPLTDSNILKSSSKDILKSVRSII